MTDVDTMMVYSTDMASMATEEEIEYYKEEINTIRAKHNGIIIAWIVPDNEDGHIDYKVFETWTDVDTWVSQT